MSTAHRKCVSSQLPEAIDVKIFLLSCLFFFLGQTSFAQTTEELPIEWDGFQNAY